MQQCPCHCLSLCVSNPDICTGSCPSSEQHPLTPAKVKGSSVCATHRPLPSTHLHLRGLSPTPRPASRAAWQPRPWQVRGGQREDPYLSLDTEASRPGHGHCPSSHISTQPPSSSCALLFRQTEGGATQKAILRPQETDIHLSPCLAGLVSDPGPSLRDPSVQTSSRTGPPAPCMLAVEFTESYVLSDKGLPSTGSTSHWLIKCGTGV